MENQSYINNFNFDESIREKMENFSTDFNPAHWDSMQQRLDEDLAYLQQDSTLSSKLESNTSPKMADWAFMSQILDSDNVLGEQPESLFDKNIREKVLQTAGRFSENKDRVWTGLEQQLNQSEKRKPKVFLMTLAKAAIVVLALLSAFQLADMIQKPAHQDIVFDEKGIETDLNNLSNEITPAKTTSSVSKTNITKYNQYQNEILTTDEVVQNVSSQNELSIAQPIQNQIPVIENIETLPTIAVTEPIVKQIGNVEFQNNLTISEKAFFTEKSKKSAVSISAFAGADINNFKEKGVFNTINYSNSNIGWTAGVKTSLEKGNWEAESGLAYSTKNYLPEQSVAIYNNSETIRQDMVQVPLHIKYKAVEKKKFSLKGLIGSTFNWMVRNDVDKRYYNDPTNPIGSSKGSYNGTHENKTYFTLDAGIVAEYKVNPKLKICFQPMYQQNLTSGVGLNNEKIKTLSFQVAAKTML